jgi:WD40 repeat protein
MRCPNCLPCGLGLFLSTLFLGGLIGPIALASPPPDAPTLVIQGGHTATLGGIAFGRDGKILVTAGSDNRVLIWDVESGLTIRAIAAPMFGTIAGVGITTDSRIAVVASASGVFGFDVQSGALKWQVHADAIFATFSPDANRIALFDGLQLQIVDTTNGQKLQGFSPGTKVPSAIALTSDGLRVAVGSGDFLLAIGGPSANGTASNGVSIFDVSTGGLIENLKSPATWFSALAFNRAGDRLAAIGYDGGATHAQNVALQIWKGKPYTSSGPIPLPDHATMSQTVSFSEDDNSLAIGVASNSLPHSQDLILYDANGVFHTLNDQIGTVWHLSLSPGAGLWAGSGPSAAVAIWDSRTGTLVDLLPTRAGTLDNILARGERGSQLFAESRGRLHQMDLSVAKETRVFPLRDAVVDASGTIVAGDPGSALSHTLVFNSASDTASTLGEELLETPEVQPGQSIYKRALDSKGTALIEAVTTNGDDSTRVTAWDFKTKVPIFSFVRPAYPRNLMVLPDDDTVVVEDKEGIELWSLSKASQIYQLKQNAPAAYFSYDPVTKATVRTICLTTNGAVRCSATALTVDPNGKVSPVSKDLTDFGNPVLGSQYISSGRDIIGTDWLCDWRRGTSVPLDHILLDSAGTPFRRIRKSPNEFGLVNAVTGVAYTGSWNSLTPPAVSTRIIDPSGTRYMVLASNGMVLAWSTADGHFLYALSIESSRISTFTFSPEGGRLFTGDESGGVRIWDIETGRFLALYVAFGDEDWVLVDDKQRFAATKNAELRIGYRIGTTAVPFEQFDISHNRPDLVLQEIGLASKDDIAAAQEAVKRRLERLGVANPADPSVSSLPEVTVSSDTTPRTTSETSINASVSGRTEHGTFTRLNVVDNGVPVYGAGGVSLSGDHFTKVLTIPLVSGLNEILVSATDKSGNESLRHVFRVSQLTNPAPKGRLFVVSVGVTKYPDAKWNLNYAAGDADAVRETFKNAGGFDGVEAMPTVKDEDATMAILPKIAAFLASAAANDEVILFFSGHGTVDAKGAFHFVTYDFNPKDSTRLGVRYQDLVALLDKVKARRKLLLLDACFAGEPGATGVVPQSSEVFQELSDLRYESGVASIAASSSSDPAYDDINGRHLGHSPFAFAVMKAVQSPSAATQNSGPVTLNTLANYVNKTVGDLTGNLQQTNVRQGNIRNDFVVR